MFHNISKQKQNLPTPRQTILMLICSALTHNYQKLIIRMKFD